jgi:sulfur-oxidizing protein SoxY
MKRLSRRQGLGGLLALAACSGPAAHAQAPPVQLDWSQLYGPWTAGNTPQAERVQVLTPRLADNGLSVPLSVRIDSPMRADDHVQRVILLSNRNPRPVIAEFERWPLVARHRRGGSHRIGLPGRELRCWLGCNWY